VGRSPGVRAKEKRPVYGHFPPYIPHIAHYAAGEGLSVNNR
jgi:hypothetical protein